MTTSDDLHIENITYAPADFDGGTFMLDRLLDRVAPLASLIGDVPQKRDLGALSVLPNDLIFMVIEKLSIINLRKFRLCNRFSMLLTDSRLRSTLQFASNTLKGMMALDVSAHITLPLLVSKLRKRDCDVCGQLAQYIYLPTCTRACLRCVIHPFGYKLPRLVDEEQALKMYWAKPQDLATVPSHRCLPVTLTNGLNKFRLEGSHRLYDRTFIECDRIEKGIGDGGRNFDDLNAEYRRRYMERSVRYVSMYDRDPTRTDITVLNDPTPDNYRVSMAVVFAPWIDASESHAERGYYCTLCLQTDERLQDLLYTKDMFLEHLKECRVRPLQKNAIRERLGFRFSLVESE
jgi:hypothetical protein